MASVASAGSSTAAGMSATSTIAHSSRCRLKRWTLRSRNGDVRDEVERGAAEQRDRRHDLERLADVPERLLEAQRQQHDPGHHRQVQ